MGSGILCRTSMVRDRVVESETVKFSINLAIEKIDPLRLNYIPVLFVIK